MTVDSTLLLIAPEFASTPVETREAMADLASLSVGSVFGDCQELATAYLTAHMLTVSQRGGNTTGAVKSRKEGELGITYADSNTTSNYGSTSYGQEFERLAKSKVFAARTRAV